MATGRPPGGNLNAAQGSITINTSQLAQAQAQVQAFAAGANAALNNINPAANKAQAGIGALAGSLRGLAGAFGLSLGIQGAVQLTKMAVASSQAATAYRRQEVAARSLAGSQHVLNEMMVAYTRAMGGSVDEAQALADITNLQAIGFAKNARELERFVVAARGISIAKGRPQQEMINELALSIANQSTRRFDQIGLSIREVTKRINELRESDKSLSREMAFQEAVLQVATEKYGELATGAEGQKTGLEKLGDSWANYGLQVGKVVEGPLNAIGNVMADSLNRSIERSKAFMAQIDQLIAKLRELGILGRDLSGPISSRTSIGRVTPRSMSGEPFVEGSREIRLDWARGVNELNKRLYNEINDAERDYGRQRADTIRSYNTSLAREERDFAISRQRQEEDHLNALADIHSDAARREKRMAEDLARNIADAQADSADRIAEAREDTTKRLVELEEDYAKNRERAAEEHRDKLLSAAGRLDAIAILEERKRWLRENKDAKEAHDDQRDDLKKQLAERIDDENKALEKSTRQQQEAYRRQLEDGRDADRLRIEDMQADFKKRKEQEDADRAIRKQDRAGDQAAQLAEMDTAHVERIAQIKRHAADERTELDTQAKEALLALGYHNQAWKKVQDAKEEALEKMWDKFMNHVDESLEAKAKRLERSGAVREDAYPSYAIGGYVSRTGLARLHRGEFVMPAPAVAAASGMSRNVTFSGDVSIAIAGSTNMGESEMYNVARRAFVDALEEVGGGR